MAFIFGVAFLWALIALSMGVRMLWRGIAEPMGPLKEPMALWDASKDAGQLRYLNGGTSAVTMRTSARPTGGATTTT
jgi:citrate/tricarballylate utilization protein